MVSAGGAGAVYSRQGIGQARLYQCQRGGHHGAEYGAHYAGKTKRHRPCADAAHRVSAVNGAEMALPMAYPSGNVLWDGESPYAHQGHPYVIKLYPLIDGEVYGYMKTPIDQQRALNRNMLIMDEVARASIKGTLLIPQSALEGTTRNAIVEEFRKIGGVVIYNDKDGNVPASHIPEQKFSAPNVSVFNALFGLQAHLIEQVSGVHGAIQGKTPGAGTSGKLYAQETANASLNTADVMQTFASFVEERNRKALKVIMQYYTDRRPIVSFDWKGRRETLYDPDLVKNADADIKVIQSSDTPVYRMATDEALRQLLQFGLPLPAYLQASSLPHAKEALAALEHMQQAQAEQQQQPPQEQPS